MTDSLTLQATIPVNRKILFQAWLNSKIHSAFTGAGALIQPKVGGKFSAWDGYISGKTVVLEPFSRIVQHWRTTEFPDTSEDSVLEILFQPAGKYTKIILHHRNIPKGQGKSYKKGWKDFYFIPMKEYFKKKI